MDRKKLLASAQNSGSREDSEEEEVRETKYYGLTATPILHLPVLLSGEKV